jgi:hypothetical protein
VVNAKNKNIAYSPLFTTPDALGEGIENKAVSYLPLAVGNNSLP